MPDIFDEVAGQLEKSGELQVKKDIFDTVAEENTAIDGDLFDKQQFLNDRVQRGEDPALSEPSFFKAYWNYLHEPPERAESVRDWLYNVLPKSISRTAVGMAEFPYRVTKSFTDPLVNLGGDIVKAMKDEGVEISPEKAIYEEGKAVYELADGLARFTGEPLGIYGWEKVKDKWLGDPAAALVGVMPTVRGAEMALTESGYAPVPEFGARAKGVKGSIQKAYDWIDIEAPFVRAGARRTGNAAKRMPAIRISEQDQYIKISSEVSKLKIPKEDGLQLTLEAANSAQKGVSTPEIKAAAQIYNRYFKEAANRAKQDNIIKEEWPHSHILRNNQIIESLTEQRKAVAMRLSKLEKTGLKRAADAMQAESLRMSKKNLTNEIKSTQAINIRLATEKPQYVHIPLSEWYRKLRNELGETEGQRLINNAYKGRFFHERKTVDIADVINWLKEQKKPNGELIFEPLDFDLRIIGANYAQKLGRMRGLAKVFNSAKADGLVIPKSEKIPKGTYGEAPVQLQMRYPELKDHYIHNAFADYLGAHIKAFDRSMELGRLFGYTKMMAFWNPVFLPMYDVWQASWLTGTGSLKQELTTFPTFRGIKSYLTKDKYYFRAQESGFASPPYTPPFEDFVGDIKNSIPGGLLEKASEGLKKRLTSPQLIDDVYQPIWNAAWAGDGMIRMGTWHYLKDAGFSDLDAGAMTAYVHGDYAKLTPAARRILNKVFFTPSFKYAMGHLQTNMVRSSVITMSNALKLQKPSQRDFMFSKGATMLVAGSIAKDYMLKNMGFKVDTTGLRYYKEVETEQGPRELVLYWPDPNNVILRQVHKWRRWGDDPDKLNQFFDKVQWDLHPVWQLAMNLSRNRTGKGREHVYNPFDWQHPEKIAWDITRYSVSELVGVVGAIQEHVGTKDAMSAYKSLQKEVGWVNEKFLSAATLAYLRHTPTVKGVFAIEKLRRLFRQFTLEDKPKSAEESVDRLNYFFKKLREVEDNMTKTKQ